MKFNIALAVPIASFAVYTTSALPKGTVKRIVAGEESPPGEWHLIASLRHKGEHFCGGSHLNAVTIITAAHCGESMGGRLEDVEVPVGTNVRFPLALADSFANAHPWRLSQSALHSLLDADANLSLMQSSLGPD